MSTAQSEIIAHSILKDVPVVGYIESKFDIRRSQAWMMKNWYYSVIASVLYVFLVWVGRKWMSEKSAFDLRRPLVMWNVGLAVFSMLGMITSVPNLTVAIIEHGVFSVCHTDLQTNPALGVWALLFTLSKVFEFGDTAFIVLRKSPLIFLHWYHHVTVCIYTWYGFAFCRNALPVWFGAMNFTVHSLMYSYFALRAARIRVPSSIALVITVLQIAQMFSGLFVTVMNFVLSRQFGKEACTSHDDIFKAGIAVYGSYAVLFIKFFYDKYCNSSKKIKKD